MRQIEPGNILYHAALLADEVMMAMEVGVEPGRFPFRKDLAHQAGFRQRSQAVVDRRPGSLGIAPVDGSEDLVRGCMHGASFEELQDRIPLRGRTHRGGSKGLLDLRIPFRHDLNLDYI